MSSTPWSSALQEVRRLGRYSVRCTVKHLVVERGFPEGDNDFASHDLIPYDNLKSN